MPDQPDQQTLEIAERALARYDAIAHDLKVRPSAVLEDRLAQTQAELLRITGHTSVGASRCYLERHRRNRRKATKEQPRQGSSESRRGRSRQNKPRPATGLPFLRGQDDTRHTGRSRTARALPPRMTGVVSGGLPATARRH